MKSRLLDASLILAAAAAASAHLLVLADFLADPALLPADEDEVPYYNAARLFEAAGAVQATSCIEEKVAPWFNANWYGVGYSLIYGGLASLFGTGPWSFAAFHLGLLAAATLLLAGAPLPLRARAAALAAFLLSHAALVRPYSFFPEAIHLAGGALLAVLLLRIAAAQGQGTARGAQAAFGAAAFLLSLLRPAWILWMAALLPFARSRRGFLLRLGACAAALAATAVHVRFGCAPAHVRGGAVLEAFLRGDLVEGLRGLRESVWINLKIFFVLERLPAAWLVPKWLVLLLVSALGAWALRRRRPLLAAAALVGAATYAAAFTLYVSRSPSLLRMSAPLLPLLLLAAAAEARPLLWAALAVLLAALPLTAGDALREIAARRAARQASEGPLRLEARALRDLASAVEPDRPHVILWCYYEWGDPTSPPVIPVALFMAGLPVATPAGRPILWTANFLDPSLPPAERFRTHGRLPVDHVLSRYTLDLPGLSPVLETPFFRLYRRGEAGAAAP